MTFDIETVPVAFNMDLANAPTSQRFCREACDLMGLLVDDSWFINEDDDTDENYADSEYVDWIGDQLAMRGYCALWNAGDVVVFDLRNLSDDDRESFFEETENW